MVTINDIAKAAGVSPATVSNTLNGTASVNKETAKRVRKAVAELGYRPNQLARSLKSGRTRSLGLIIPDLTNPFFSEIACAVSETALEYSYTVTIYNSASSVDVENQGIELLYDRQVDGLLIIPVGQEMLSFKILDELPTVFIDRIYDDGMERFSVTVDNERGGYLATKHLLDLGHTEIGFLSGFSYLKNIQERLSGYYQALEEAAIDVDEKLIVVGDQTYSSGKIALDLLEKRPGVTGILVSNDAMAIGTLNSLQESGFEIPADISVIGYDNISLANLISPALTTVNQPRKGMGRVATERLIQLIEGRNLRKKNVVLEPKLVVRESCGVRKKGLLPEKLGS